MPSEIHQCWEALLAAIREEFLRNNQHPNAVFEADRSQLKLRACLNPGAQSPEWYAVTLTEDHLLSTDIHGIAREFYATYRRQKVE